jgi:hypothetical protein
LGWGVGVERARRPRFDRKTVGNFAPVFRSASVVEPEAGASPGSEILEPCPRPAGSGELETSLPL